MWNVLQRAMALRAEVRELPDRVRVSSQVSSRSGLVWSLTRPGIVELVRTLTSRSQNPSRIYRIHARNSPNKAALIWRGHTQTWAELDERIDRISAGLGRRGIGRKQSVIVMMRNRPECVEVVAAAARGGAAAATISWRSTSQELAYLANHSGARGS